MSHFDLKSKKRHRMHFMFDNITSICKMYIVMKTKRLFPMMSCNWIVRNLLIKKDAERGGVDITPLDNERKVNKAFKDAGLISQSQIIVEELNFVDKPFCVWWLYL